MAAKSQKENTPKKKGYKVTVVGDYYSSYRDADGHVQKKIRRYEVIVNLPSMDAALSNIRNHLLKPALKNKYPDATDFRTHVIKNVESFDGREVQDLRYMNARQMQNYIEDRDIPIDVSFFTDVQDLREALHKYKQSPEAYLEWFESIKDERASASLLKSLNPGLFKENSDGGNEGDESKQELEI